MKITIYGKPNCMQCIFARRYLDERNVPYQYIDVFQHEPSLEYIKSLGIQAMPVIEADGFEPFNGMRPEILVEIVNVWNESNNNNISGESSISTSEERES